MAKTIYGTLKVQVGTKIVHEKVTSKALVQALIEQGMAAAQRENEAGTFKDLHLQAQDLARDLMQDLIAELRDDFVMAGKARYKKAHQELTFAKAMKRNGKVAR